MITEKEMKIVQAINDSQCEPHSMSKTNGAIGYSKIDRCVHAHANMGHSSYDDVCTRKEFNQCVEEMANCNVTSFPFSRNYKAYKLKCNKFNIDTSNKTLLRENCDQSLYKGSEVKFKEHQTVYIEMNSSVREWKFGCYTLDGESCILLSDGGHMVMPVSRVMAEKPKSKQELELEAAKIKQVDELVRSHSFYVANNNMSLTMVLSGLFTDMQNNGHLAEIILPLEE